MYHRLDPKLDAKTLENAWIHAVELATKFCGPEKQKETIRASCAKLIDIHRYEAAAEVYVTAGEMYKEAIDCCIMANLWEKAKNITKLAPKYAEYVDNLYAANLKKGGNADKLINHDVAAGLELYSQRGEWIKCLDAASTQGPEVLVKYLSNFCIAQIKEARYEAAVKQIVKYGAPFSNQLVDSYTRLTREVLHSGSPESIALLREMLFKLVC